MNLVHLIGHLGKDADVKAYKDGEKDMVILSIATSNDFTRTTPARGSDVLQIGTAWRSSSRAPSPSPRSLKKRR